MIERALLPLLVVFVFVTQPLRHCALFVWSITFQTNLMGWISQWPGTPHLFNMLGSCYLLTVALLWFVFLGGKESSWIEYAFNVFIHYVTCIPVVWNARPESWPSKWWLTVYPLFYWLQMPFMNRWAGWQVYPVNTTTSLVATCVLMLSPLLVQCVVRIRNELRLLAKREHHA